MNTLQEEISSKELGRAIAILREECELNMRDFSKKTGIAVGTICGIEHGRNSRFDTLVAIANKGFNISLIQLLTFAQEIRGKIFQLDKAIKKLQDIGAAIIKNEEE